jgi:hypothetical protein
LDLLNANLLLENIFAMDNSQGNNGDYKRRGEIKPRKQGNEIEGNEGEGDRRKWERIVGIGIFS